MDNSLLAVRDINHKYIVVDITKIKDKDFADFRRENLGFIFQDFNLLNTLTIEENISLSLVINKRNPADIEKRVHAIADKLGIRDILSKFPYEVSGGQKQRLVSKLPDRCFRFDFAWLVTLNILFVCPPGICYTIYYNIFMVNIPYSQ